MADGRVEYGYEECCDLLSMEIGAIMNHFNGNKAQVIEFLMEAYKDDLGLRELQMITGAEGYSRECILDLIYCIDPETYCRMAGDE